jgi:anti-sigma regulatory factor (Ser/Thr protein kinase)
MSLPSSAQSARTTSFDLVLPPDPELLRVVRLVASGLASLTPLDLDAVEEVRVAADELVSTLMQASAGGPVTVSFAVGDDVLTVSAVTQRAHQGPFEPDPLTERILDEVATGHAWHTEGFEVRGQIDHALLA